MKTLKLKPYFTEDQCEQLIGNMSKENDYDLVISNKKFDQPVALVDAETNEPVATFVPNKLQKRFIQEAYAGLRNAAQLTNNRGSAAGSGSWKRIRADGSVSKANIGMSVRSSIIGFYDRYERMNFCRSCAWNYAHPNEWQKALPLFAQISQIFKEICPDKHEIQRRHAEKVHPDFIIPDTVFSTITVNKNFRTAYHRDALNLHDSFSAFNVINAGDYQGGLLVFPKYRVALACNNGDLLFFKPQEVHGNTPIIPMSKKATYERISMVYYLREKMVECGSMAEELERGKKYHGGLAVEESP